MFDTKVIKEGDYIRTPRFLTVRIEAVYQNRSAAYEQGFKEPTHYDDPSYDILGKSIGLNRMIFAAVKK